MKVLIFLFLLSACQMWGSVLSGISEVGTILFDDRSLADDTNDAVMLGQIKKNLISENVAYGIDVMVCVFEGNVLLTGTIPSVTDVQKILEIIFRVNGVKKVYNHIRMMPPMDVAEVTNDTMIYNSLMTQLRLVQGIDSANYKITVDGGIVYIMGIAQNQNELNMVLNIIYRTKGVRKNISYVRIKNDFESI